MNKQKHSLLKLILILIFSIAIFNFGCVSKSNDTKNTQTPANEEVNSSVAPDSRINATEPNITQMCLSVCDNQERPPCQGSWTPLGNYPDCNCRFTCIDQRNEQDGSINANTESEIGNNNQTRTFDYRSTEVIMNQSVNRMKEKFYSQYSSGIFTQTTYTVIPQMQNDQESIPFTSIVDLMPQINNQNSQKMIAFANLIFKDNSDRVIAIYSSILTSQSEAKLENPQTYRIKYGDKEIFGCVTYSKDLIPKRDEITYTNYLGECSRVEIME